MRTYLALSRLFPRSFRAKLVFVVLACILPPKLGLVVWLLVNHSAPAEQVLMAVAIGMLAVLVGVLAALVFTYHLLQPLRRAAAALDEYERHRTVPQIELPPNARDDMARLLRGIQRTLRGFDQGRRQLERHALEDPLTEAMNRRGCGHSLRASVARAEATGEPFVLCVVDLDNLKRINDEAGHAEGDYALVSLVRIARECCLGAHDWIGRWGGDEFMLGLHADPDVALDRVRVWIGVLGRPEDGARAVEVSVGAATWRDGLDAATLYRQADAAMYRAKFAGGKRLVAHRDEPAPGVREDAPRYA